MDLVFEELEPYDLETDNFGNPDFLETINDLLYAIYALGEKQLCLEFYEYFENVIPIEDKRIWTWKESSLLLFAVLFDEIGDKGTAQKCLYPVKEAFNLGNDLVVTVNENARKRKMNGDLLPYSSIKQSIEDEEKEDELTYRLILLKGLIYIKALGFSDSMLSERVNKEINENIEALKKLL